ncbi:hypothetical protein [Streptomyces sp. Inha503]|uniref:hypothetical protein n=1 Tax=Streptomyces sp. Inha503 TaxID=3383314 RepID=UPI0039A26AAF
MVSTSLTCLETGLDDYFATPVTSPPLRQPDTYPPDTDDDLEEGPDDPGEDEPDNAANDETAIALPPLVLLSTVAFGMADSDMHDIDINPLAMATAWASIFTPGLLALTYTFHAWLGQIRHTTEGHRPRG